MSWNNVTPWSVLRHFMEKERMSNRLSESVIFYVVEISGAPRGGTIKAKSRKLIGSGHKVRQDAADKAKKMAQNNPGNRYYVTETVSGFRRSNLVSYKRYDA